MTEPARLTPGQLAEFDQAYAASRHLLRELVEGYGQVRRHNVAAGLTEQISIMMLATALTEQWCSTDLIYALTAAVVRIEAL